MSSRATQRLIRALRTVAEPRSQTVLGAARTASPSVARRGVQPVGVASLKVLRWGRDRFDGQKVWGSNG